jgi:2,4-dienoyl-CoA reductase-like NADH-dependent reductase (Old Yellow Enzyme family)
MELFSPFLPTRLGEDPKKMSEKYPHLFSPLTLHTMTLKNRVVMPPMCTDYATIGGAVTDRLIDYYTSRARGGVGLINVEFAYVHPGGKVFEHMLGICDDQLIPGLRRLTDSVRQAGARIILQIAHGGRGGHSDVTGSLPLAPSPFSHGFLSPLSEGIKKLRRIGNAAAPRKLFDAVHEGYRVGIEI